MSHSPSPSAKTTSPKEVLKRQVPYTIQSMSGMTSDGASAHRCSRS